MVGELELASRVSSMTVDATIESSKQFSEQCKFESVIKQKNILFKVSHRRITTMCSTSLKFTT